MYCETGIVEALVRILKAPIASMRNLSTLSLAFDALTQAVLQPLLTIVSSSPSSSSSSPSYSSSFSPSASSASSSSSSSSHLPSVSSRIQTVLKDLSVVLTDSTLLSLLKNPRPSRSKKSDSKRPTYLSGCENMLLSPLWHGQGHGQVDKYRSTSHNYMNEDETELVHAVLVTQTAFLFFLQSYVLLSLKSQFSSSTYLDLSACSIALADVVSDESAVSRHRSLAASTLEHMIALSVREVCTTLPSSELSRFFVLVFLSCFSFHSFFYLLPVLLICICPAVILPPSLSSLLSLYYSLLSLTHFSLFTSFFFYPFLS